MKYSINTFNYHCLDWIEGLIERFKYVKLLNFMTGPIFYTKITIQKWILTSKRVVNLNRMSFWLIDQFRAITKFGYSPRATICRISVENEIPIPTDFTWLNRSEVNDISKMIEDLLHKRSMKYVVMWFNEKSKYLTSVGFPGIAWLLLSNIDFRIFGSISTILSFNLWNSKFCTSINAFKSSSSSTELFAAEKIQKNDFKRNRVKIFRMKNKIVPLMPDGRPINSVNCYAFVYLLCLFRILQLIKLLIISLL